MIVIGLFVQIESKHGEDHPVLPRFLDAASAEEGLSKALDAEHKESKTNLTSTIRTQDSTSNDSIYQIPHLIRKLASLSLMDTTPSKNITISKCYHKSNKTAPEQVVPLCRVNHLFKLDASKSFHDTLLRSYIKSTALDTRPRRRVYNSRTAILPSAMGNRHTVSSVKHDTGMHELVKKSFMVNKVSSKSLMNIKVKPKTLPLVDTNIKIQTSKSSLVNCSAHKTLEEGKSCQGLVVMNNQQVKKTPVCKTNTEPDMEKGGSSTEENIHSGSWFTEGVNITSPGTIHSLQDTAQLTSPSIKIPEQPNPTWNGDGECTSMNRILAWDPWAGLNKIGEEVSLTQLTGTHNDDEPMDLVHETGKDIAIIQSSPAVPVMPILKGCFKTTYSTTGDIHITMSGPITYPCSEGRRAIEQQGGDVGLVVCEGNVEVSGRASVKRVQWSQDVQVIYYAGDTDEGTVLGTQIEPLREEAEQQARANQYSKNFVESPAKVPFIDPWFPILRFNK